MLFIFLLFISLATGQVSLGGYNVDLNSWSVSGISSGACMATQMHVAYASSIMGAGMVAGTPYYCSDGRVSTSLDCMSDPQLTNVPNLINEAQSFALSGDNDPTGSISGDKVFVFHGTEDTTVMPGNGPTIEEFYGAFGADILTEYSIPAVHGFPTDFYGSPCGVDDPAYINNCGYNAAYEILNHIYGGNLVKPDGPTSLQGDFYMYDQSEFFLVSPPGFWSVDDAGYVYVPSACVTGTQCRLHVAFHGCSQGSYEIGTTFCTQTGYREVGELNNIIILFPQAESSTLAPTNPFGCWDWWGYNTNLFANKDGGQPLAVWRMMRQVSSQPWS